MSARFFEAPDAWGDECLWEQRDDERPMYVMSRYDLEIPYRDALWPLIVKAVVAS